MPDGPEFMSYEELMKFGEESKQFHESLMQGMGIVELADLMTDGTTPLPHSGAAASYIITMLSYWLNANGIETPSRKETNA